MNDPLIYAILAPIIGLFFYFFIHGVKTLIDNQIKYDKKKVKETTPVTVSCETCGCLINKDDAKKVVSVYKQYGNFFNLCPDPNLYYCRVHAPKYDRIFYNDMKFKELEVDDNGEPIGYKKIK